MMFIGQYESRVDSNGRIPVPSEFRRQLRGRVFLWRRGARFELHQKIRRLSKKDAPNIVEVRIDRQGRVQVPKIQRDQAGMVPGQVWILQGRVDHVELVKQKRS